MSASSSEQLTKCSENNEKSLTMYGPVSLLSKQLYFLNPLISATEYATTFTCRCSCFMSEKKGEFQVQNVEKMRSLQHKTVAKFFGTAQHEKLLFTVTEGAEYGSLYTCLLHFKPSLVWKINCLLDVAKGLSYLHSRDVCHGDLCPQNVLVFRDFTVKVTNFGLHGEDCSFVTSASSLPPESRTAIVRNSMADVFAFGVLMSDVRTKHQLLPGVDDEKRPNYAEPYAPVLLSSLLTHCCEQNPCERPSSAVVQEKLQSVRDSYNDEEVKKARADLLSQVEQCLTFRTKVSSERECCEKLSKFLAATKRTFEVAKLRNTDSLESQDSLLDGETTSISPAVSSLHSLPPKTDSLDSMLSETPKFYEEVKTNLDRTGLSESPPTLPSFVPSDPWPAINSSTFEETVTNGKQKNMDVTEFQKRVLPRATAEYRTFAMGNTKAHSFEKKTSNNSFNLVLNTARIAPSAQLGETGNVAHPTDGASHSQTVQQGPVHPSAYRHPRSHACSGSFRNTRAQRSTVHTNPMSQQSASLPPAYTNVPEALRSQIYGATRSSRGVPFSPIPPHVVDLIKSTGAKVVRYVPASESIPPHQPASAHSSTPQPCSCDRRKSPVRSGNPSRRRVSQQGENSSPVAADNMAHQPQLMEIFLPRTHSGSMVINIDQATNVQTGGHNHMIVGDADAQPFRDTFARPNQAIVLRGRITHSNRQVTREDAVIVSQHLGSQWKSLARRLDLSEADIDMLHHDYAHEGLQEKILHMVLLFKERNGQTASAHRLAHALCVIERADIALKIPKEENEIDV